MDLNASVKLESSSSGSGFPGSKEVSFEHVDPTDMRPAWKPASNGVVLVADAAVQTTFTELIDSQVEMKTTALRELDEDIEEARLRHDALQRQLVELQAKVNSMTTVQMDEVSRRQLDDLRWQALHNHLNEDRHVLTTVVNCVNSLQHVLSVMPHHVRKEIERLHEKQQRYPLDKSPHAAVSRPPDDFTPETGRK